MFSLFRNGPAHAGGYKTRLKAFAVSCLDKKDFLNYCDKVLLPESVFTALVQMDVSYPMTFQLTNSLNAKNIHCGVHEFTAEEGIIYLPGWVMEHLEVNEGEALDILNVTLPKGSFVQIRPHKTTFIELSNPRVVLEHALRNFTVLTKGTTVRIRHAGHNFDIDIMQTRPGNAIVVVETDIQVDFVEPLDAKEIEERKKRELEEKKREQLFNFGGSPVPKETKANTIEADTSTSASSRATASTSIFSKSKGRALNGTTSTAPPKPTTTTTTTTSTHPSSLPIKPITTTTTTTMTTPISNTQKSTPISTPSAGSSSVADVLAARRARFANHDKHPSAESSRNTSTTTTPSVTSPSTPSLTTKIEGNFRYFYDSQGRLIKREPLKSEASTSQSNGRTLN